jgi:hypothetical protein
MKRAHGEEGLLSGEALHLARVAGGGRPSGTSVPWPGSSLRPGEATGTPGHGGGLGERAGETGVRATAERPGVELRTGATEVVVALVLPRSWWRWC